MRGVSLEELSSATRISTRFLAAIETGHWEELPGGAFNRGFIRSASRYLGLDEDGMVAEYSLETSNGIQPIFPRPAAKKFRRRQRTALTIGAAVVLIAGGWLGGSKIVHRLSARTAASETTHAKANNPVAPTALPDPLTLVVHATSSAQVVVGADGKSVFEGQLQAGEEKTFTAERIFDVSANDAAAVRLELNGQPVAPMGLAKQPGGITLTAKDVKSSAGGSH